LSPKKIPKNEKSLTLRGPESVFTLMMLKWISYTGEDRKMVATFSMSMKKMLKGTFGFFVLALGSSVQGQFLPVQKGPEFIPNRYIVILDESKVTNGSFAAMKPVIGGFENRVSHVYNATFPGFAAELTPAELARVKADPRVVHVEQDQVVRLSAKKSGGRKPSPGTGTQPSQSIPWGISRIMATGVGTVDVDVAIIDTGIDLSHPDLNVAGGRNFAGGNVNSYSDGNGHGTHVSGTVAALDNNIGVVGVAPGARLWAVRVLDNNGSGTMSGVISGVDWVTANARTIEVANMSLGGGNSAALNAAIDKAVSGGVTFVVAAGNSGVDTRDTSPANSTSKGVITVSAMDSNSNLASFSNFGINYETGDTDENGVDVTAPGVNIYSTYKGSSYTTMSGTSMASPHAAGVAALCKSVNPSLTPEEVKFAVMTSAPSVNLSYNGLNIVGSYPWAVVNDYRDGQTEPLVNASAFIQP
jgi:subtilisin